PRNAPHERHGIVPAFAGVCSPAQNSPHHRQSRDQRTRRGPLRFHRLAAQAFHAGGFERSARERRCVVRGSQSLRLRRERLRFFYFRLWAIAGGFLTAAGQESIRLPESKPESKIAFNGRNMPITMPPTMIARKTIMSGSSSEVIALTAVSTSS